MINMKIELTFNKVIIYLYQHKLNFDNLTDLNNEIKKIIIKIISKYQLDFSGYSKVSIYNNDKYGSILEIEKIYNLNYSSNINLKIIVYKNVPLYLEFDNLYFDELINKLKIKNNKYYISVDDIDNIIKYIEYGRVYYRLDS